LGCCSAWEGLLTRQAIGLESARVRQEGRRGRREGGIGLGRHGGPRRVVGESRPPGLHCRASHGGVR
jgi:hypothetical protein